jgi:spermidine synthase
MRILGLLAATIGLPYFLLASTTPLIGAWYWRRFRTQAPYRLFALSNLASLLALLGFPFLIEPLMGNRETAIVWSVLFGIVAIMCITTGYQTLRADPSSADVTHRHPPPGTPDPADPPVPPIGAARWFAWIGLSAIGSAILLAVTGHLTQNISSAPLLWVVPLSIYLITFIICFDHPRWYQRRLMLPLAATMLAAMAWLSDSLALGIVSPVYALGLFSVCMACHGELAARRPHPTHLTAFYLSIAAGGALGSVLIAIAAPILFDGYYELQLVLIASAVAGLLLSLERRPDTTPYRAAAGSLGVLVLAVVGSLSWQGIAYYTDGVRFMERDFYGVVRTKDHAIGADFRSLIHGGISHGGQLLAEDFQMTPSSYFGPTSGYGRLFASLPAQPRRVGIVGLGAGALAAYARPGDHWVFYEISPAVIRAANREFTFLDKMPATHEVVLGDGRLALARENSRQFDVLALDAFSGDSIPTHLITREAMDIYVRHLKPDGVIVFQATNRFVDLLPLTQRLAESFGMTAVLVSDSPRFDHGPLYWLASTDQVLMSRDPARLSAEIIRSGSRPIIAPPGYPVFTDDYINLLRLLKWKP